MRPARVGEVLEIRCEPVEVRPGKAVVRCEARSKGREGKDGRSGEGALVFFGKHELESVVKKMGIFGEVAGNGVEREKARL